MHFSSILSFVAAFSAATAFTIPPNQPEGVYSVHENEAGVEVHTFLRNITKTEFAIRGVGFERHEKRQQRVNQEVVCKGFEGSIPDTDNSAAAGNVAAQCGNGAYVGSRLNYYGIFGCSVAYFCNLKYTSQICTSGNAWASFTNINNVCGYSIPGYEIYTDTDGQDQYGYENYCTSSGAHFCR